MIKLLGLCLVSYSIHAQDMGALSPQTFARPTVSFEHQEAQVEEQKLSFGVPVYKSADHGFAVTGRAQRVYLGDTLRFPSSKTRVAKEFGSADFGMSWSQEDAEGNKLGANATYGDAGTRLFSGENSPILSATFMIERKKTTHSWLYFLNYSNNRTLFNNIPIPGFAYTMNGATYTAVFGLPFIFVNWRPDPWMLTAVASPFGGSVEPAYRFWGPLQAYANYNWSPKSYPNLIPGSDKRLIYDKFEAGAGVRMLFGRKGSASVGYVHTHGRRFMIGESLRDEGNERFALEDNSGLQIKTKYTF